MEVPAGLGHGLGHGCQIKAKRTKCIEKERPAGSHCGEGAPWRQDGRKVSFWPTGHHWLQPPLAGM